MESSPKSKRGLLSGFLQSGFSFGFFLAAISFQIISNIFVGDSFQEYGWRVLFFTGLIPGLVALFVRLSMDESPLWNEIKKSGMLEKTPLRKIVFGKESRKEFLLCAAIMTGLVYMYHGSISILPTFLQQFGKISTSEIGLIMIYATFSSWLGMIFTGWLSQRIGRKKSILIFCVLSIAFSIPIATEILLQDPFFLAMIVLFAFLVSTASGPVPAFFSERFSTQIRNSAAGFSYNAGLIFGSWSPLIALMLVSNVDKTMIPLAMGANIIIGAIIVIVPTLLSRETKEVELV